MTDSSAPTYRHLLEKAQEIGRADGRFAAAFEPPGSDAERGPRSFGRTPAQLRPVTLEIGVNRYAEGSCLVSFGNTKVLVTATVYMLLNLLADIGYILVNPRLRT